MGKISPFHLLYKEDKEYYNSRAKLLSKHDCMKEFNIGNTLYNLYFKGYSKIYIVKNALGTEEQEVVNKERRARMIKKAGERGEDCVEWFKTKVKSIAYRLGVSKEEVLKMINENGFAIRELEFAEKVDGKILVPNEIIIRARKPSDWRESMINLSNSLV